MKKEIIQTRKRKKKLKIPFLTWAVLFLCTAGFLVIMSGCLLLNTTGKILIALLGGVLLVMSFWLAVISLKKKKQWVSAVLNLLCALLPAFFVVYLPQEEALYKGIITPRKKEDCYSIYALRNAEREQAVPESLTACSDRTFLLSSKTDEQEKKTTVSSIEADIGKAVVIEEADSLFAAVQTFYERSTDLLVVRENDIPLLEKYCEGADTFSVDTYKLASYPLSVRVSEGRKMSSSFWKTPFAVLFTIEGVHGDSEAALLMAADPKERKLVVVSLPADTLLKNPALQGEMDLLSRLLLQGKENQCQGAGDLLHCKVDHYISIDAEAVRKLINAAGGVDIENPYAFEGTADDSLYYFPAGSIHLNGDSALAYLKAASEDDEDPGRNKHQMIILKALVQKTKSIYRRTKTEKILQEINGAVNTDLLAEEFIPLLLSGRKTWDVKVFEIEGDLIQTKIASFDDSEVKALKTDGMEEAEKALQEILEGQ